MSKLIKVLVLFLLAFLFQEGLQWISVSDGTDRERIELSSTFSGEHVIDSPQTPHIPDAELSGDSYTHQVSLNRVQRAQLGDYFFSLKSLLGQLADRASALSQHKKRLYATTTSFFRCYQQNDYYVFALRQIII
ncbi:MAG: hypothetical protein EOM31_05905 [Bacteroidia bacterium]|nr:hypothetical protein [Bacteroidia bacterium]